MENNPPNQLVYVSDIGAVERETYRSWSYVRAPQIQLHCDQDSCNGIRFFRCVSGQKTQISDKNYEFFMLPIDVQIAKKMKKHFPIQLN